jgi:peptidoglycan/xylan/chitin deacetylase (PgdA/CDA1 family)
MDFNRLLIAALLGPELARWKARGKTPVFWWRDDDARRSGPALDRLLSLSHRHQAPLTIAAVPDGRLETLAEACAETPDIELAIHGFRHENRAPTGQPSGEINDGDTPEQVLARLDEALAAFAAAGVRPTLFVPPWNNVHPTLEAALAARGVALSGWDQSASPDATPPRLDAHLDVMRWKPKARFRGAIRFLSRARRLLAQRRKAERWDEPMGFLTHHLDHDEAAWAFTEIFVATFRPVSRRAL